MKKRILVSVATIILMVHSMTLVAFAADDRTLKVYYSEPLGTSDEQKVFQITSCKKTPAYAPLRCNESNADSFAAQCKEGGKINDGKIIRGCLKNTASPSETEPAPVTNTIEASCRDDASKQGPHYAREYGVVIVREGDDVKVENYNVVATVVGEDFNGDVKEQAKAYNEEGIPIPLYRSVLCTTWDVVAKPDGTPGKSEKPKCIDDPKSPCETVAALIVTTVPDATELINDGCNNNNGVTQFDSKESVTCSVKYRISGATGTEIFSNYIKRLYQWAATIVGIIAVFTIVYSGIQISMSGDGGAIDNAKNRILQSLVGIAILFLSGLILYTINPSFFTGG